MSTRSDHAVPVAVAPVTGAEDVTVDAGRYASWSKRVLAYVIDTSMSFPFILGCLVLTLAGTSGGGANPWFLFAAMLVAAYGTIVSFYNRCIMMGLTGQSWGKRAVGIRVVSETTREPIGVGNAIVREMAHAADYLPLGMNAKLDRKGQTVGDKVARSIVVEVPRGVPFRMPADFTS